MDNISMHEANKAIRVLSGEKLKYTVRIFLPDDSGVVEFQTKDYPKIDWNQEARALWLCGGSYGSCPIMPWKEGMVILTEQNPDWKE
jgi:hypothetical protein